jgi:hypothetical protein
VAPYRNSIISRQRLFPTGAMTAMILGGCFCSGYFYARLKNDEYLRRIFYGRYFNFITMFDFVSLHMEDYATQVVVYTTKFDSAHAWWHYKKLKLAEYRARKKLEPEITKIQATDPLSKHMLALDEIGDRFDLAKDKK